MNIKNISVLDDIIILQTVDDKMYGYKLDHQIKKTDKLAIIAISVICILSALVLSLYGNDLKNLIFFSIFNIGALVFCIKRYNLYGRIKLWEYVSDNLPTVEYYTGSEKNLLKVHMKKLLKKSILLYFILLLLSGYGIYVFCIHNSREGLIWTNMAISYMICTFDITLLSGMQIINSI